MDATIGKPDPAADNAGKPDPAADNAVLWKTLAWLPSPESEPDNAADTASPNSRMLRETSAAYCDSVSKGYNSGDPPKIYTRGCRMQ